MLAVMRLLGSCVNLPFFVFLFVIKSNLSKVADRGEKRRLWGRRFSSWSAGFFWQSLQARGGGERLGPQPRELLQEEFPIYSCLDVSARGRLGYSDFLSTAGCSGEISVCDCSAELPRAASANIALNFAFISSSDKAGDSVLCAVQSG
jgi:hypothetical protein